ncbi:MAG: permease [Gemmataceae bacterium]
MNNSQLIISIQSFLNVFISIVWEAMPFIVLGAVIAGILEELLPQRWITKFLPRSALPAVIVGGLLGLVFPMCECGIVVVMRRLLRKGLPLSCCIAYMLAGPILNVVVLFSTYIAFKNHKLYPNQIEGTLGPWMVIMRAGFGVLIACTTAMIVHYRALKSPQSMLTDSANPKAISLNMAGAEDDAKDARKTVMTRVGNIAETALHDFVDIMMYLIIGALLAAIVKTSITQASIASFSLDYPYLAIPATMLLAVVMCLCSEADAFVAASFTEASVASKLAFLVLGPMLDLKLLMMYTRVFKPKLIMILVTCTVTQTLIYSVIVHVILTATAPTG